MVANPNSTISPAKSNFTANPQKCFCEKIPYAQMTSLSRHARRLGGCLVLAFVCLISLVGPTRAAVIEVGVDSYKVNGGPPETAAWDVAERLAVAKDVAIVVMNPKANKGTVQVLMQNLETLKIPTLFTKKADYDVLLKRGFIKPAPAP